MQVINVGVHQGSVLSPLLFIMFLVVLSQEFRTGCPWELLCIDNLVIFGESVEELFQKLTAWKVNFGNKGLKINMKKAKVMFTSVNMDTLFNSGLAVFGGQARQAIQFIAQDPNIMCRNSAVELVVDQQKSKSLYVKVVVVLPDLLKGTPVISTTLRELAVNVVDTFWYFDDTNWTNTKSSPKLVERFLLYVSDLSCCMVVSAGIEKGEC